MSGEGHIDPASGGVMVRTVTFAGYRWAPSRYGPGHPDSLHRAPTERGFDRWERQGEEAGVD